MLYLKSWNLAVKSQLTAQRKQQYRGLFWVNYPEQRTVCLNWHISFLTPLPGFTKGQHTRGLSSAEGMRCRKPGSCHLPLPLAWSSLRLLISGLQMLTLTFGQGCLIHWSTGGCYQSLVSHANHVFIKLLCGLVLTGGLGWCVLMPWDPTSEVDSTRGRARNRMWTLLWKRHSRRAGRAELVLLLP